MKTKRASSTRVKPLADALRDNQRGEPQESDSDLLASAFALAGGGRKHVELLVATISPGALKAARKFFPGIPIPKGVKYLAAISGAVTRRGIVAETVTWGGKGATPAEALRNLVKKLSEGA
jgi:hypothetical protein